MWDVACCCDVTAVTALLQKARQMSGPKRKKPGAQRKEDDFVKVSTVLSN